MPKPEKTHPETRSDEQRAVKDILGPDAFSEPDRRPTVWPEISKGEAAVRRLRAGAKPSDILKEFQGSIAHDIALPSNNHAVRHALKKRVK